MNDPLESLIGQEVILDTSTAYLFVGKLVEVEAGWLALADVDVHDSSEGHSTKERYIMEARKFGIKMNRRRVSVRRECLVSVSRLEDVIVY